MAEHRDEQAIRVARIDDDLRNLLTVAQSEVRPGFSGVRRFVDTVAHGQVGTLIALPASYVDDVGIGFRHGDGTDRAGGLVVEDRSPNPAVVRGLPHATVGDAEVEHVWPTRYPGCSLGSATPKRPDHAPPHLVEQVRGVLLRDDLRAERRGPR